VESLCSRRPLSLLLLVVLKAKHSCFCSSSQLPLVKGTLLLQSVLLLPTWRSQRQ
jgi:hypothetical protein